MTSPARPLRVGAALASFVLLGWTDSASAAARCPSYQRGTTDGTHHCGVAAFPGTDPTFDEWKAFIGLASQGPKKWGSKGPKIPDLKAGCTAAKKVAATFPCEILGAVAAIESNWHQFCVPTEPPSERNKPSQTLITRDCGHGVAQVTSGMREGASAPFDRDRVASDPFYNLAVGASILADKWRASDCVGAQDPTVLEHWYVALWKYNGYSYSNDPSNPAFSSTRGIWNPAVGGDAPYQEKVFGIIERGSRSGKRWTPIALAYPRIEDVAGRVRKPVPEPSCASPTDCTKHRPVHRTLCTFADPPPVTGTDGGSAGTPDSGHDGGGTTAVTPPAEPKKCGCAATSPSAGGDALAAAAALLWAVLGRRRRSPEHELRV
jgi:uncharacterized protein (TIGR03382 family)